MQVPNHEMNRVYDWIAKHATFTPEKLAIVDVASGRRINYREFNEEANRAANLFESLGAKAGDRIAIIAPNSAEILFTLFGATKIGAIFVPLNHKLPAAELLPIIQNCEPMILIYAEEFAATVSELRGQHRFSNVIKLSPQVDADEVSWQESLDEQSSARNKHIPVDQNSPQMLLYTSGTTGKPKGVILPHRMQFFNAINFALRDLNGSDRVLIHTPMFYTGGLNVYTTPSFLLGGTVVIMRHWEADEVLRIIERERITAFFAVPTQFLMMANSVLFEKADLSSLKWVISGGAPCPLPLMKRLMARGLLFKQGFGMTEVGVNCFCLEIPDAERKIGSIGFPNFAMEARIVDDDGVDVAANVSGELILRTPCMCNGYWNNPEQTAQAIRDGWFYTGDIAKFDDEGYCYIVDRKKDMFISGGENVYPAEVEKLLIRHPKILEVAVVGVPNAKWGEVGAAVVILKSGESATEEEILSFCQSQIAKFKIPRSVYFVQSLPRTVTQKVQKQELKRVILVEFEGRQSEKVAEGKAAV
ncbi:MAG: AMP-dependent synthetase and ligase [Acidobacteriaceae bacterium]|nr:AMP-dependent synthetase and ligase [Acidobacteriaceae bacterium]